jgi:hypothetical protein
VFEGGPLIPTLLLLLVIVLPAYAKTPARWRAASPAQSDGLALGSGPGARWRIENAAGQPVAAIIPVDDYFRRAAFLLRLTRPLSTPAWLSLEYLDRGYGLISIVPGVAPSQESGVARLNTGRFRHAVFRLDHPALEPPIRVYGLQYLRSASLTEAAPAPEAVPDVKPALEFRIPSQRVTTAGADARTIEELPEARPPRETCCRPLGFSGVESYVKWNFVERSPGVFDWSFYDAIVDETGEPTPGDYYARFVLRELRKLPQLRPALRQALQMQKPAEVYWSVLENGRLALLNFTDDAAAVRLATGEEARLQPYAIWMR